jgi:serine/threonine-protein kinase
MRSDSAADRPSADAESATRPSGRGPGGKRDDVADTVPQVPALAPGARQLWSEEPPARLGVVLEPGTIIEGKYRVVRPLGEGAMGVVVLARDEVLERDVAIKVIRPAVRDMIEFQDRFLHEARAMAAVRNESVVAIHSFGTHESAPYFVMEYIPGTSLERWLQLHNPMDIDVALGVLAQACRGVQAIHDAGAVHLDIKPANVLVGPAFRVAVTDLGLARRTRLTGADRNNLPGGTPQYMAPELVFPSERGRVDWVKADIYSLGVLAFELLTGHAPFEGESASSILMQQVTAQPVRPSELRGDLPEALDVPILRALAKNPQDRPPSASAFYQALLDVRSGTAPSAGIRILVADDDATFRALARSILSQAIPGAQVSCVADGEAALSWIDRNPPELVLLDLQMPGLNGLEVMAAMRGSERAARTRVIVATAVGTAHDWKVLSEFEADAFLVKPVTASQMKRAVSRILGLPEPPATCRP